MTAASMLARLKKLRAARPAPLTDEALQAEFAQLVALHAAQRAGDNMAASKLTDAWRKANPDWWRSKDARNFHHLPPAAQAASMAADAVELDALISAVRAADLSSYA